MSQISSAGLDDPALFARGPGPSGASRSEPAWPEARPDEPLMIS